VQAKDSGKTAYRLELLAALALTILAASLHIIRAQHAGGLWRDEANSINLATMPALADVWNLSPFDSFPIAWFLVLRGWTSVAGEGNDAGLRILGVLVGVGILGALWLNARRLLEFSVPLLSLALVGLNPEIIRSGDSMRAYGAGTLTILLACGLVWHAMRSPTPARVALAVFGSVLAVQTLFQNAVLLLAIGVACMIVAARRGLWRRALIVAGVGLVAALTLIPYIATARRLHQWDMIVQLPPTPARLWMQLTEAIGSTGRSMVAIWVALAVLAIVAAVAAQARRLSPSLTDDQRDLSLFGGVALVSGIVFYVAFLLLLKYCTRPWYYITLASFSALAIDAALSVFMGPRAMKAARIGVISLVTVLSVPASWRAAQVRQTNIDLIAEKLEATAAKDDLIILNGWEIGITFDRYYRGPTPWMTIPPLDSHKLHRYDLVKVLMSAPDPMQPVFEAMTRTLRSGRRIWIIGGLPVFQPGQQPDTLPPPPLPRSGWQLPPYEVNWVGQAGFFLQNHATSAAVEHVGQRVNSYECPVLEIANGWNQEEVRP
jgi:uncharacterized membrane protein